MTVTLKPAGDFLRDDAGRFAQAPREFKSNGRPDIAKRPIGRVLHGDHGRRRLVDGIELRENGGDLIPDMVVQREDHDGKREARREASHPRPPDRKRACNLQAC